MKVLLDENLDHKLRKHLGDHEVFTVRYMGWSGLGNGDLLRAAEENGIEVLVTGDQNLAYQQNLAKRQIAIVTLSTIDWTILRDNLSLIVAAVDNAVPGSFQAVECGTFSRKQQENQIEPEQEQEQDRERER